VVLGPTTCRRWSYAASKLLDEYLALAYHAEYGLDVVIVRLFNTVGARQTGQYGMVLPRLVRQALQGDPITVYGDGLQTRCFCDVRDVVPALIGVAECERASGRIFNVGGTDEIAIVELAKRVKTLAESNSAIELVPYNEVYPRGFEDMRRRVPDTTRVRELLGWTPSHSLQETITSVIEHERRRLPASKLPD
jgi:UDP-glucose 4-epimerase